MSAGNTFVQMVVILLIIAVGFLSYKKGIIDDKSTKALSALTIHVFNPAIIFSSMIGNTEGGRQEFVGGTFGVAAILFATAIVVGMVFSRLLTREKLKQRIFHLMFIFSNMGFIGIPVVSALFGREYIIYVAIFVFEYNVLFYTFGLWLIDKDKPSQGGLLARLKPLLNMGTLSCVAALTVFVLQIQVPTMIGSAITYLGNAAVPIPLIVIGATVASHGNLVEMFKQPRQYGFLFLKMLALPLISVLILKRLPMPEDLRQICMIMMAMPVGTMPLIVVTERGIDARECSDAIILTTIFSVLTIPLMVLIYQHL